MSLKEDVLKGLSQPQKSLPPKYFYDRRGSELFEKICELDVYYPFRCEMEILGKRAAEIAALLEDRCNLIEFGSGSSTKTKLILDHLSDDCTYTPVEVSGEFLEEVTCRLKGEYPRLKTVPICGDFTQPLQWLNQLPRGTRASAVFFPGSTLGNFDPPAAKKILRSMRRIVGAGGRAVIGIDLMKDAAVMEIAYNDPQGVTAEFNLNLLSRINRELSNELKTPFSLSQFRHYAFFNSVMSRIEMHLISEKSTWIELAGQKIHFEPGESIHTENSYKYDQKTFEAAAKDAGFSVERRWTDAKGYFAVYLLQTIETSAPSMTGVNRQAQNSPLHVRNYVGAI